MSNTKRLMFVAIIVVGGLTAAAMGLVGGARCLGSRRDLGNFNRTTLQCWRDESGISVEVVCRSDDWANFPGFKINSATVAQTTFKDCNHARRLSLLDTFHSMNINSSIKIHFQNPRRIPNRQYFQNISVYQKLEKLEFSYIDNFTSLPFDLLYDVLGLKIFIIRYTDLDQIPNNFFNNNWSSDLQTLDLTGNELQKISRDDLAHLRSVRELVLYGNEITEIEIGAFDNLINLATLQLGKNRLKTLPSGVFRHLARLETLDLDQNPFDGLPSELFTSINNCHIKTLHMKDIYGSLRTLPNGFFMNLAFLAEVYLENNQLENLPADLFDKTSELEILNLRNNSLKSLPSSFFNSFKNLKTLDLAENQIENLPAGIFQKLDYLEDLDVSYNNLTTLKSDVLEGLCTIKKLNISHNNLIKLDNVLCYHLGSVEIMDFSFNRLTFEALVVDNTSVFKGCYKLANIILSNNGFQKIFNHFSSTSLNYFDFSFNNLTEFTAADIESLRIFQEVDIRNNNITKIDLTELASVVDAYKELGNNFSNRSRLIVIGNNPLHCDCNLIDLIRYWNSEHNSELRQYVKLTASNDGSDASMTCASPPEFKGRDLRNIRPEELSCVLNTDALDQACTNTCSCREYPAKQVLFVDCSYRNLTQLPAKISNVHNWSIELNMSHNVLTQTPSREFDYLANLTSLDLSNNNISTVTMDIFSNKLIDLKLHNNSISRLDHLVVKYLANNGSLRTLTLHQNPWLCDCEARSFLTFIQKKTPTYRLDRVMCSGTNNKLYKMTVADVCQSMIAIIVGTSLLVACLGITIGILAALYYKYQKEIKVWLYSKHWCLWFVTENELDQDKKYDAFVSFSHKDEDFVEREIVAKLEDGPRPYKLCLHYRDWLAGEWIPVQISQSVEESRRTIVVLSPSFLESVWGRLEFRTAHTQALNEGRARVIIILYGEIENMEDLDPELKSYLSLNTYLKWGDPWFWDKLRYALPHRTEPSRRKTRNARIIEDHLMHQPVNNDSANAIAKSDVISMSKLVNDSTKLLGSGVDERTVASS